MLLETKNTIILKKEYMNRRDLAQITIPPHITTIESWAFAYCENLKSIAIPDTVVSIGQDIFQGCKQLKNIAVYQGNPLPGSPASVSSSDAISYCTALSPLTAIAFLIFTRTELCIPTNVGSTAWVALWDDTLLSYLRQPDTEGFDPFQAGGEEDYEDPDNHPEYYCHKRRMQKIRCIFERLLTVQLYPVAEHIYSFLLSYLAQCKEIIDVLIAESDRQYIYFNLCQKLHLLDAFNIPALISTLPEEMVELKALLMRYQTHTEHKKSPWDSFIV